MGSKRIYDSQHVWVQVYVVDVLVLQDSLEHTSEGEFVVFQIPLERIPVYPSAAELDRLRGNYKLRVRYQPPLRAM